VRPRKLHRLLAALAALVVLATASASAAEAQSVTIEEAIRAAWTENPGLRASSAQVEAARAEAARARAGHLPTLSLSARGVRTDQPMMAFGKLMPQGSVVGRPQSPSPAS